MQKLSIMRHFQFLASLVLTLFATLSLSAQSVRVIFVTGQARIQAPGENALRPLAKGDIITLGARIVTGPDGRVALTPLPGVHALITPNTDLLLEAASEAPNADGRIAATATLDLKQGSVVTDILKQDGVSYDYNVRTPRGLAGARGTNYTVAVNAAGIETVIVAEGAIIFNLLDGRQLAVSAGQVTLTDASGAVRQAATLSELSAADQAFAQEVAQSTLAALESALDAGITLNPDAIDQALRLFESFGLDVSDSSLQPLSRLRAALESLRQAARGTEDPSTIVTDKREDEEDPVVRTPYETFLARLSTTQSTAFAELLVRGGFDATSETFLARFSDESFTTSLLNTVNLYANLSPAARDQGSALGIFDDANEIAFGSDPLGLARLLNSYTAVSSGEVTHYDETAYGPQTSSELFDTNIFFNGASGASGSTLHNVAFGDEDTDSNLFVGAARFLIFEKNNAHLSTDSPTFDVASGRDIFIRAAEQISLRGDIESPVTFGRDTRGLLIESITINLANVDFTEGSVVVLTSRDGGLPSSIDPAIKLPNFGHSVVGRVNFLGGVHYGRNLLQDDESFVSGTRGNIVIASFADGLSTLFPDYTPPPEDPTPEQLFAAGLTPDQLAIFNLLPTPVRLKLVNLDDSDITTLLLAPDRASGVPPTSTETDRVLDTYAALSSHARNFVKTLAGGTGMPNPNGAPDLSQWSTSSLEEAATVFDSLAPQLKTTLVALGAGDAIVGLKPDYITGLVAATSDQTVSIAETGWGRYLDDLVSDSALSSLDEIATSTTRQQRQLIHLLGIDPYRVSEAVSISYYEGGVSELAARLDQILENFTPAQLNLLSQLGYDDSHQLFSYYTDPIERITSILENYNTLSPDQQIAARALRLGSLLSNPDRATAVTNFYLGLPVEKQEALRDTGLARAFDLPSSNDGINVSASIEGEGNLDRSPDDTTEIESAVVTALETYLGLSHQVQTYLIAEAGAFKLFAILNSDTGYADDNDRSLRPLSEIVSIISNLTTEDFQTLLDLDLARAVLFDGYLDAEAPTNVHSIRDALAFYRDLTPAAKSTMRELGIIGSHQVGFLGSDYSGVTRLLQAYAALPLSTRLDTQRLDENKSSYRSYDEKTGYFFPYNKNDTISLVSFSSPSDLHVGAIRRLRIDNSWFGSPSATFIVQGEHTATIYLRAGDLIHLNKTPISGNARGILMDAITINLANLDFPEGTTAALTSRDGGLHFGPNSVVGGVNFLSGVTYGGAPLDNQPEFDSNSRGNIAIGSFTAPAALPNYTPPAPIGD